MSDYRKENERFVEKVSSLQKKLGSNHSSVIANNLPNKSEFATYKDRMESTTSYFSDEDDGVREFAYGKIKCPRGGEYEDADIYDET